MLVRDTRETTVLRALAAHTAHLLFPRLLCRFVCADAPGTLCSPSCCSSRSSSRAWGARWACTKTMTRKPHSVIPRRSLLLCAARACARSRLRTCSPVCVLREPLPRRRHLLRANGQRGVLRQSGGRGSGTCGWQESLLPEGAGLQRSPETPSRDRYVYLVYRKFHCAHGSVTLCCLWADWDGPGDAIF